MRTVFELKVWHQDERSCFFLLLWDNRSKKLTASLPYPIELQKAYQLWQQRYHRFYKLSVPQSPGNSGRLNPGSGDLAHDLTEAEKGLVKGFQRWLGEGDGRTIQQQIQNELAQLARLNPHQHGGADVFLACDSDDIARLPWELWSLATDTFPADTLRIVRTAMDEPEGGLRPRGALPGRKARILAVLGNDPNLPLQEDWKSVRSLRSMAHIEQFSWQPDDTVVAIKQKFAHVICDSRGWDVLFFAGHSDETMVTGGRIAITPKVSLSISELEEYLTEARENGLQLAIFNSCNGLSIANSLVTLGLQVVVMREPIRNDVAQSFLKPLCQQLAKHQDIHRALLSASHHLQSAERFAYPSTHLIPSFFSPSGAIAYRLAPFGWKKQLRQWLPTKQEALVLTTATLLTLINAASLQPLKTLGLELLNRRIWSQAIYRNITHQIPKNTPAPVLLVAIDQKSINKARSQLEGFQHLPMDREYLANLIQQLSDSNINVIGIDYLLDEEKPKEEKLANVVQQSVQQQGTWFIFGSMERDDLRVHEKIASPEWSLNGDVYGHYWQVKLPIDITCVEACPFAYLLSLANTLNQSPSPDLPQPDLQSQDNFQQRLSIFLSQLYQGQADGPLKKAQSPLNLPVVIDYSIPPEYVYKHIPAWKFLEDAALQQDLSQQVAIIASGGYYDAEDKRDMLPALQYWCDSKYGQIYAQENCPRSLTGGEIHAYTTHHLLSSHQIVRIPDWWMIFAAALLGKWAALTLSQQQANRHQRYRLLFLLATMTYGLIGLQAYIWAEILLPWLLPSAIFWAYVIYGRHPMGKLHKLSKAESIYK
ncbi:MAG: CHAT domain-containing protein [Leptolyngbyaceae cyanobacterium MAG.088]|nr:CHAT domain-containing protein [Leptolyngbyaceae cyanobacterium MAG.088]